MFRLSPSQTWFSVELTLLAESDSAEPGHGLVTTTLDVVAGQVGQER